MRSTLLCLAVLTTLSACSSGGGGGGKGQAPPTDPRVVAQTKPQGQFAISKESALGKYGAVPTGFSLPDLKCGDHIVYDSRLRAGDVFTSVLKVATRDRSSNTGENDLVRTTDETHSNHLITYTDLDNPTTVTIYPIEVSCAITQDKEKPIDCSFKTVGVEQPQVSEPSQVTEEPQKLETCSTDYGSQRIASSKGTVALGTFTLASGQRASAQRLVLETSNVDFKCGVGDDQRLVGTGKVITDQIETRDLVTLTPSTCSPSTTVYRKTVYQLDDGTILYATVDEKTQAPQR